MMADGMGCIVGGSEHAARLVEFWQSLEMFSPRTVPGSDAGPGTVVLDLQPDAAAPWEDPTLLPAPGAGRVWRYDVYGGLFELGRVRDALARAFGPDALEPDARRAGTAAAFALTLTDDGLVVRGSARLSATAWAISRLRSPGVRDRAWLHGFADDAGEFATAFDALARPIAAPEEPERAHRWRDAAVDAVGRGVGAALVPGPVEPPKLFGPAAVSAWKFSRRLGAIAPDDPTAPTHRPRPDAAEADARRARPEDTDPAEPAEVRVTGWDLHGFVGELCGAMGVRAELRAAGLRVVCRQVAAKDADLPDDRDPVSSLLTADLARVATAVRHGDHGAALADYLSAPDEVAEAARVDVRAQQGVVIDGLIPERIPDGRWPGEPLVTGQQFAIDRMTADLGEHAGVFAVHGPPGTGTTTMLRDTLAGIVVERAAQLATFEDPTQVFTVQTETVAVARNYPVSVHRLAQAVGGHEVVLAAEHEADARNMVAEISQVAAVGPGVGGGYFTDLASLVLGEPAWGLIATTLGGQAGATAQTLWFGDRFAPGRRGTAPVDSVPGLLDILKRAEAEPDSVPDWETAVADFRQCREEVRALSRERQAVADAVAALPGLNASLRAVEADIAEADAAHSHWRERHHHAKEHLAAAHAAHHRAGKLLGEHGGERPGFGSSLSSGFRAGRQWSARTNELLTERHTAEAETRRRQTEVDYTREEWAKAAEHGRGLVAAHLDLTARRDAAIATVERARDIWAATIPFGDAAADDEQFELCRPWADDAFAAARRQLFVAALRLHRAFLLNAAPRVRDNLTVAIALIRGELPRPPRPETVTAAWQTLFLAVPLVATTFTDLPRVFAGLGREALGWLFVDDAGRVAPQAAVGALWRSRRAVVVGDHRQLEPVVSVPSSAQRALAQRFDLDERWLPDRASVRSAADRIARFGTWMPPVDDGEPEWVGTPLRVHRRCDRPMFELSQRIAYGGDLLFFGTPERPEFPGANAWIDVRSERAEGKWIPGEGEALADLLDRLREDGIDPGEVRVLSPFRDVARGAARVAADVLGEDFARRNVGTIHDVQGKSADVVVLILGTSPAAGAARRWAAATPNLLNVAVSRARRRFYVIGNHRLWSTQRHFAELAAHWPVEAGQLVR
ncbi:DEAD/DEAH box helicase [Nocardia thailandica]